MSCHSPSSLVPPFVRYSCCSSTGVTSVGLPKLLGAIAVNKSLTALSLEGNALPAEAGGAIASALQRTSALTVLCVGSNHLGDAGIIAICRGIRTATESQPKRYVSVLECRCVWVCLTVLAPVFPLLIRCPLTLLDVSRNGIGQKGSLALADLLRSPQFPLSDLLLAYNPLSQDGTVSIANAIRDAALTASRGDPKSFKLRYVDITGVDVGISGLTALKDAITSSRSVIGSGPGDSLSESGDSFEVDGLEELWIPAASAPVVGKLGLLSSSRSDVSGFSMAGPMSVVEPKAPAPEVIPPPAPTAPPLHPTAKITSASPPAPPSPPRTTPAMSPPLSQHNTQLVPLPTGSAQSSLPHSVRLESLTPNEATSMLIDLLHKQLEDQALQINELREMLSKAGKVPIGTAGRASSASLPDERDVSASKPKGLSKALELVASRGALESEADRSFRGLNSSTSGPTVSLGEWGFKSAGIATSAAKRLSAVEVSGSPCTAAVGVALYWFALLCCALQDAILELASEIRWVDEEGVKARLEAESLLRARVDALSSRLDTFEETVPVSTKVKAVSETPATHRYRSGSASAPHTPARPTDAVLPRDTLVKHVRV